MPLQVGYSAHLCVDEGVTEEPEDGLAEQPPRLLLPQQLGQVGPVHLPRHDKTAAQVYNTSFSTNFLEFVMYIGTSKCH